MDFNLFPEPRPTKIRLTSGWFDLDRFSIV